jgi:anti-anti-sigma factor
MSRATVLDSSTTKQGPLSIRSRRAADDRSVIELEGELDLSGAPVVQERLREAQSSDAELIVDLSALTFIDSAGIRVLHQAQARSSAGGANLSFVRGTGQVQRVMALTRLDTHLRFTD